LIKTIANFTAQSTIQFKTMFKILLTAFTLCITLASAAQIAGPNSGSTFTNVAIAGSNKSWTNTGNAAASDNVYTSYGSLTGSSPSFTDYLQVTGFGFSIPSAVSITGIVVEVERSDPNQRTADNRIRIVKGGVIGATERSSGAAYSSTDGYQSFGNSGDLWGETWTEADINAGNFGVAISAVRTVSGTNSGRIDHIRIIVYYDFVILPVKLTSFNAVKNNKTVDLQWTTAEETNMNYYEVQKSVNGNTFATLNTVNSRGSSSSNDYLTSDQQPNKGINYYRLKMTDNNGKVVYSKIAAVYFSNGKNIILYPNPWQKGSDLNISNLNGELITIDFYSPDGRLIGKEQSSGRTVATTALLHVKGLILYKLRNKDGSVSSSGSLQVY
jgi:hypothetical protein